MEPNISIQVSQITSKSQKTTGYKSYLIIITCINIYIENNEAYLKNWHNIWGKM